jgi:hypothetical protein
LHRQIDEIGGKVSSSKIDVIKSVDIASFLPIKLGGINTSKKRLLTRKALELTEICARAKESLTGATRVEAARSVPTARDLIEVGANFITVMVFAV